MDIVCVLGSPRPKGNSSIIAKHFCQTSEELGANIKMHTLNKLKYKGCQGCLTCKTKLEHCVLKDDLTQVLEDVAKCDVLVVSSPIYFSQITGQLKSFIDRTFSYLKPNFLEDPLNATRLEKGKQFVFIQTQGQPDEKIYADVFIMYDMFFKLYGFNKASHLIVGKAVKELGDAEKDIELMKLTKETAKKVME